MDVVVENAATHGVAPAVVLAIIEVGERQRLGDTLTDQPEFAYRGF
jgi:hypothetical protein